MKSSSALVLICCVVLLCRAQAASAQDDAVQEDVVDVDLQDADVPGNEVDADNEVDAKDVLAGEDAGEEAGEDAAAVDARDADAAEKETDADNEVGAHDADASNAVNAEDPADQSPAPPSDTTSTTSSSASSEPDEPADATADATTETPSSASSAILEPPSNRSVAAWFRMGVEAYLTEDWKTCATALENALQEWQYFLRANINCRLQCGYEARRAAPLFEKDIEHLQHTEELVRATLCIMKCKRRAFHGRVTTDTFAASDQKAFRDLKVYEYLQLCYYQSLQFQKAASAVFTIISHNPSNEIMRQNLKYYLSMPEVDPSKLENYESKGFVPLYLQGTEAYFSENYESAVSHLEESLQEFLTAVDQCRADCEGPFDQGWLPDFTPSITNHYVFCLKCKTKCHSKLSQINGEKYDDFLPLHYNYLQFAYFKLGRLKSACEAAATYLMFLPADETMLENVEYYKGLPKFETSMLQPRMEAVNYLHRQTYEDALLKFVADEFIFPDLEEKDKQPQSDEIASSQVRRKTSREQTNPKFRKQIIASQRTSLKRNIEIGVTSKIKSESSATYEANSNWNEHSLEGNTKEFQRLMKSTKRPIFNFREEGDLGGEKRFIIDGLANKLECQQLEQFGKVGGVRGDGYDQKETVHFKEIFEGTTLGRAALMVHFGLIKLSTLQLFLSMSERSRNMVATYFNIPEADLHFSFTHLVCRSAVPGNFFNDSTFSHKIHADNCWFMNDGTCVQAHPAYYWRDYSAILYLNDDFDGGEFVFSADQSGKLIQSSIKPTCGRLVGFSAGLENLHGVRGMKRGTRCALALWFTLDAKRSEWGRKLSEQMIHYLETGEQPNQALISNLEKLVGFNFEEAKNQMQMSQTASCDSCSEEMNNQKVERESVSITRSNHSQH